jgi:hypothetical protein
VHFSRKTSEQRRVYTIGGVSINSAEKLKYLGITLTSDLSWKTHIKSICGKAMKNLGFIKRVVG